MKLYVKILILVVLIVAIGVRMVNLDGMRSVRADEESWIVNGHFLLKEGVPKSWTIFLTIYKDIHYESLSGEPHQVVQPYLDHPPLFSLIMGTWTALTRTADNLLTDWMVLRLPMIGIAVLTIIATTYLTYKLFGPKQSLLTLLAFSFMPSHMLSAKLIMAEHLIALLLVVSLISLIHFLQTASNTHRNIYTWLLVSSSFAAVLTKLSGGIVPLILIVVLLQHNQKKTALLVGLAAIAALISFAIFGCYYDADMFFTILTAHSLRPQTFWYFFTLFSKPDLGYFPINDPMPLIGIIGSLLLVFGRRSEATKYHAQQFVTAMWVALAGVFIAVAPIELYGWYKFLMFPLIAIGIGRVWYEFYRGKVNWIILLLPALLVLSENVFFGSVVFDGLRRFIVLVLFGTGLLFLIKKEPIVQQFYPYFAVSIITAMIFLATTWSIFIAYG